MRDYTIELPNDDNYVKERERFILKYRVNRDDKIIKVYYANGKYTIMKYNIENEKKILECMKQQVLNYKEVIFKAFEKDKDNRGEDKRMSILFLSLAFFGFSFLLTGESNSRNLGVLLSLLGSGMTIIGLVNKWRAKVLFDDFKKNLLFVENEAIINKVLSEDSDILLEFSESILKGLVENCDSEYEYTINSIDRINYQDLIEMLTIVDNKKEKVMEKK